MTPTPPSDKNSDWNSIDAINLRNFLGSQTGERLLTHLGESVPELLGSGDTNAILIRSGQVKGGSELLSLLVSLTIEPPASVPKASDKYPDLDDDSKWSDETIPETPKK